MNVIELRNHLNKLIEEGKGEYKVVEDYEGFYELDSIDEGFVVSEHNDFWNKIEKSFYRNEDLKGNEKLQKLYNQKDTFGAIYIRI